ncbi:MAG: redox-regulated ATPase YchF [Chloroflexi bacterium]|nr:MAG: redox-regulated ATPase YchF [Chloroflexota bacterium]TMC55193.1 MAG: redox-regulated ATPase YchF [Chloroflexota bacterium]
MNLVSTITGLPYTGKTTLFNLLTGGHAATGAFAGAEAETNVGVAKVPDERVAKLAALFRPKKTTYAEVMYRDLGLTHSVDRAALASIGSATSSISAQKLGDLRSSDALVHVVRAFRDPSVPHVDSTVDPVRDLQSLELELLFADHGVVERRLERIEPELRSAKGAEREAREREKAVLQKAMAALDSETPLRDLDLDDEERKAVRGFRFLTLQPQLIVANIDEADVPSPDAVLAPLRAAAAKHRRAAVVPVCAKLEAEIAELPADEAEAFRADLGVREPALSRVIHATYELLGLISFFTTGEDEVRAWTIPANTPAQQAAGAIHSDLERGFIRAEVIRWDELLKAGSEANAKKAGTMRTEGKQYPVADGDCLHVLFNV